MTQELIGSNPGDRQGLSSRVSHSSARGLRTKRGCSPTSIEISKALQQGQEDPVRDVVDGDGLLLGLPILTPTSGVLAILGLCPSKKNDVYHH